MSRSPDSVFEDRLVRRFVLASLAWGVVALLVGALLAIQLVAGAANASPEISFGRLRPVHSQLVLFAFVGNAFFAGTLFAGQRLLSVSTRWRRLGELHFWLWQLAALATLVTLVLGIRQGKELAEAEWPIDVLMLVAWFLFAAQLLLMIRNRGRQQVYIALWFLWAGIVLFGGAHLINSLVVPIGLLDSYSFFGGLTDAWVQSWYTSNAIGSIQVVLGLGLIYFFLPAAAGRDLFSYRLAAMQFWALLLLLGWTGSAHLLNTPVPDGGQTMAVVAALLLVAPSLGGAFNGLMTLGGTWDRLRSDPALKFFTAALVFYGLAVLEAPILGLKSVSALAEYTDWGIGHAHLVGMGFVGCTIAGMFYWLAPVLWASPLRWPALANAHFYVAVVAMVLYLASSWIAGATQGLMWQARGPDGALAYNFMETARALDVLRWARVSAGGLYVIGFLFLVVQVLAMAARGPRAGQPRDQEHERARDPQNTRRLILAGPVGMGVLLVVLLFVAGKVNPLASLGVLLVAGLVVIAWFVASTFGVHQGRIGWHRRLENNGSAVVWLVGAVCALSLVSQLGPIVGVSSAGEVSAPLTPLQVAGRAVYVKEGCQSCHSQLVRPFLWEAERYGDVSESREHSHDHPSSWGHRRIGPDLARIGSRYSNAWHFEHLVAPDRVTVGSNMPSFEHLLDETIDLDALAGRLSALARLGVPYGNDVIATAARRARDRGREIADELAAQGFRAGPESKMVALIAYLQSLAKGSP